MMQSEVSDSGVSYPFFTLSVNECCCPLTFVGHILAVKVYDSGYGILYYDFLLQCTVPFFFPKKVKLILNQMRHYSLKGIDQFIIIAHQK